MKKETKTKLIKTAIIVGVVALIFLAIFLPLKLTGALDKITSAEQLRDMIQSGGVWSYLIFFVIQFLQVTFLPIPGAATTLAGMLAFENGWIVFGISFVAVMLASVFSFFLGRKVGKKLVVWVAGEKDYQKWAEKLGKGKFVFFLMMLFPVFPDDILCMVVGTTNMTWRFFIITNLITRPIGIAATCFLGSGIIPFAGWWIALWVVLGIACVVLFILSYKFQPQIEAFILRIAKKFERKKSKKNSVMKEDDKANLPDDEQSENLPDSNEENVGK
ncbi:MAG: TVP38/TMEM64 family protein [Clostridia bacterium]|nr:TVP38/TMEM64 family protein [Clostridia bacterium]